MQPFFALLAFGGALIAQQPDWFESVHADLADLKYPPLAVQARIAGAVRLSAQGGRVEILSGHPLLAAPAIANLKTWKFTPTPADPILIDYVFKVSEDCKLIQKPAPHCADVSPTGPVRVSGERRVIVTLYAPPAILNP